MGRFRKRRRFNRRRSVRGTSAVTKAYNLARKANSKINRLRSKIHIEVKTLTRAQVTLAPVFTPVDITHVSDIDQGTEEFERVGDAAKLSKILTRGAMVRNGGSSGDTLIRMVYFLWMDDSAPQYGDLFIDSTGQNVIHAFRNLDFMRKARIIIDRTWILSDQSPCKKFFITRKLRSVTRYDGPLGDDRVMGSLWRFIWSDQAAFPPAFTHTVRLRFTDS